MIELPSQQSSVNNTGSRIDYALQSLGWRRSSLGRRLLEELGHEILHLLAVLAQAPSQLQLALLDVFQRFKTVSRVVLGLICHVHDELLFEKHAGEEFHQRPFNPAVTVEYNNDQQQDVDTAHDAESPCQPCDCRQGKGSGK